MLLGTWFCVLLWEKAPILQCSSLLCPNMMRSLKAGSHKMNKLADLPGKEYVPPPYHRDVQRQRRVHRQGYDILPGLDHLG